MDKVIELKIDKTAKKSDETILKVVGGKSCGHGSVLIDVKNRTVECQECKEQVNVFDALLNAAKREAETRRKLDELDKNVKQHHELRKKLRSMTRYKCRHCNKYNEAFAKTGWNNEVTGVDFEKVDADGKIIF